MIHEGYAGVGINGNGALECHTDLSTCCRGTDDPTNGVGRGNWYLPSATNPLPGPGSNIYRTRQNMVVRLNRVTGCGCQLDPGVYRCEIPTTTVTENRYIGVYDAG